MNDIGAKLIWAAGGALSATAAGTGDATKKTGSTIDRLGYASGKLVGQTIVTLASDKALNVVVEYQLSANNSDWDTAVALYSEVAIASVTTAITAGVYKAFEVDLNLDPFKRYIRFNVTPDLTAAGTDTAALQWGMVLGGYLSNPVTASE